MPPHSRDPHPHFTQYGGSRSGGSVTYFAGRRETHAMSPPGTNAGPMASERMLPLPREDSVAIPIFVCTRTVYFFEIVCHPFFVFGQREVALFEPPKFAGFGRQTSRFQQFCGFGRFRTVLLCCYETRLLCCEHETSSFKPGGSSIGLPVTGTLGSHCKSVMSGYRNEQVK
jgi:hypothetical protein